MREEIALSVVLFVVVFVIVCFICGLITMSGKELKILIIGYACVCVIVILLTGKWW
jgi:hypothetical protein